MRINPNNHVLWFCQGMAEDRAYGHAVIPSQGQTSPPRLDDVIHIGSDIFRGGGHVFGVLDGQVEMMVVFVTGGPHVTIVVHVQPQPHQLLDQAPLSQRVRPVLRPGLRQRDVAVRLLLPLPLLLCCAVLHPHSD